ncbi:MAG: L,D-transpeptidase family protein [Chitinophagaceae bacterium]
MTGMKTLFSLIFVLAFVSGSAQPTAFRAVSVPLPSTFIDYQKTFSRPDESFRRKEDTLQKQFAEKKLKWPANYIYIRSFKYDSQLEVWVKDQLDEPFKLFKTYKVCALAGTLGPKRMEGDYQVPEGYYYINEFNPNSQYYLSLGLNYPNLSDRLLSDSLRPGGAIYIHGSCVTVGCIPITDQQIDELYILAAHARNQGQEFIPVHVFPVRFNKPRSLAYLNNMTKDDAQLKQFTTRLQDGFDYFEKYHQLPVVMINEKGDYLINDALVKKEVEKPVKRPVAEHRTRNITGLADAVHQWPVFPGGGTAFMTYLDELGESMENLLPEGIKKVFVQLEFIVDKDGVPTNFKVLRGMKDEEFNDELITRLEKMPVWSPAILHDKPVPKKMVQTVTIERRKEVQN